MAGAARCRFTSTTAKLKISFKYIRTIEYVICRMTIDGRRCALPIYFNNRAVYDCIYMGGVPSCPTVEDGDWAACQVGLSGSNAVVVVNNIIRCCCLSPLVYSCDQRGGLLRSRPVHGNRLGYLYDECLTQIVEQYALPTPAAPRPTYPKPP